MEMKVYNHKVFVSCENDEELSSLKKSLRIWFRDRFGQLQNHILLNFKEKSFPAGYFDVVIEKLNKKKILFIGVVLNAKLKIQDVEINGKSLFIKINF